MLHGYDDDRSIERQAASIRYRSRLRRCRLAAAAERLGDVEPEEESKLEHGTTEKEAEVTRAQQGSGTLLGALPKALTH